jgi:hypothetical protein
MLAVADASSSSAVSRVTAAASRRAPGERRVSDRLLVSGSASRHDVRELERKCEAAGFTSRRTATFGIGVLSYFMLADRLEISTRRSLEPGDAEATGWHFSTEGLGAFGELRKCTTRPRGTEVRLHLRPDIVADSTDLYQALTAYLSATVKHTPCQVRFLSALSGEEWSAPAGWVSSDETSWKALRREMESRAYRPEDEVPTEQLSVRRQRQVEQEERDRRRLEGGTFIASTIRAKNSRADSHNPAPHGGFGKVALATRTPRAAADAKDLSNYNRCWFRSRGTCSSCPFSPSGRRTWRTPPRPPTR